MMKRRTYTLLPTYVLQLWVETKVITYLYKSLAGSNFCGTEMEIWAGFGTVGSTEKKNWADYEHFLSAVFSCFREQYFFFFQFK